MMDDGDYIPVSPKHWWRLLILAAGTIILIALGEVVIASPEPPSLPSAVYSRFMMYCLWYPGPMMLPALLLALWWVVDLRRRFIPAAGYFAALIYLTAFSINADTSRDWGRLEGERATQAIMWDMERMAAP